jgi:hypothetical protein
MTDYILFFGYSVRCSWPREGIWDEWAIQASHVRVPGRSGIDGDRLGGKEEMAK